MIQLNGGITVVIAKPTAPPVPVSFFLNLTNATNATIADSQGKGYI